MIQEKEAMSPPPLSLFFLLLPLRHLPAAAATAPAASPATAPAAAPAASPAAAPATVSAPAQTCCRNREKALL